MQIVPNGPDPDQTDFHGSCHCGTVTFQVHLSSGLHSARRCDCSICRMRGAVVVSARLEDFTLLTGADAVASYRFNTRVADHHFCRNCGIYTHHQRRSNPDEYGINVACLDGVSPFDFAEVPVNDGRDHPADGSSGVAGTLIYRPNSL
ncbi:MAG: aldehyde-activating protein [Paracoccus denitrificans]|nr:MAG: aldehyde-activating protein [Paracoccus denitrificans]PZO85947.1 MAG: aldehyde-activating protein [Paracoccus denitrificans]